MVSNIINKEKQVIINNEKPSGSQKSFVGSDNRSAEAIKDLGGEIKSSFKNVERGFKSTQSGIRDIKTSQGIQGRLNTFRFRALNKKK